VKAENKVRLALLWHMHQPVYGLPDERELRLPWVRMHALRGYLWLARLAARFPKVRQTINLVPSLLAQAQLYEDGCTDTVERLARIDASALIETDKRLILEHFFSINPRHHILPYPRYRQLLEESRQDNGQWALNNWLSSEWRDLQVWFHLSSLDPDSKQKSPLGRRLIHQGKNFNEEDKRALLGLYRQALKEMIPTYKRLWDDGVIELSTTPYYHPILPLLCDARIGRVANPGLPDYDLSFRWPEDAELQIERALAAMEKWFGRRPVGIWPSEGSISKEVIDIFQRQGICWCASDEAVLEKSWATRDPNGQLQRNQPYRLPDSRVALFFRNHDLSDRLGFTYQNQPAKDAVEDFINALLRFSVSVKRSPLISVILDGENPWEHYPHGGKDFLETLFARLSDHPQIETVTFSQAATEAELLPMLLPGSWINGNFDIWIGDVQDRNAWRLVAMTRDRFQARRDQLEPALQKRIMELIMRAEGSDWTWWYGSEHPTKDLLIFDGLLRDHLLEAFKLMGEDAPLELLHPVAGDQRSEWSPVVEPQLSYIDPRIELRPMPFFEWVGCGRVEARGGGGSMHQVSGNSLVLEYGYSERPVLYLRCPLPDDFTGQAAVSAKLGESRIDVSLSDLICANGELTARVHLKDEFVSESLPIQVLLDDKRFAFILPPPDPYQLKSNWLV